MSTAILWPTFALVLLIFVVLVTLAVQRFGHVRANPPRAENIATSTAARAYFEPVEPPANNLANLFEMPVLYFALVPLLLLFRHAGHFEVVLAWIYVALRLTHSLIHIGRGKVTARFMIYLASCLVLGVMWTAFAIHMASVSIALANQGAL
jgi:hypothetical protein